MASKIVILGLFFAAVVALHENSVTREIYLSRQSEIEADYLTISTSEHKTISAYDEACNILFHAIACLVDISFGVQNESDLSTPEKINDRVYHELSDALSATVYAIGIIQPDPSADATRWDLVRNKLKEMVVEITGAISLSINSCGTVAEIEEIEIKVKNRAIEVYETFYNSMSIGRLDQTEILNSLRVAQAKALSDLTMVFRATFAAIKILHEINSSELKTGYEEFLSSIEFLKSVVFEFQRHEIMSRYDLLYIIYTINLLDSPKIATHLSALYLSETKQIRDWNVVLDSIWSIIYETKNTITKEAAKDKLRGFLTDAIIHTENALNIIKIEKSSSISLQQSETYELINVIVEGIFDAIEVCPDYYGDVSEISVIEERVISALWSMSSTVYEVTSSVSSDRIEVAAAIRNVEELATRHIEFAFRTIFDLLKFIVAQEFANAGSSTATLFSGIDAKSVILSNMRMEIEGKSELFRKLYIFKILIDYHIIVRYSSIKILLDETQVAAYFDCV